MEQDICLSPMRAKASPDERVALPAVHAFETSRTEDTPVYLSVSHKQLRLLPGDHDCLPVSLRQVIVHCLHWLAM